MDPTGLHWHRDQIARYRAVRPLFKAYRDFLLRALTRMCSGVAPLAMVEARAKTVASFAEKAIRRLPAGWERWPPGTPEEWLARFDPVRQLCDLCGARVITMTQYQMDRVCSLVRACPAWSVDPEQSEDKRLGLGPDRFGYTSVHYVLEARAGFEAAGLPVPPEIAGLKAEIQVRTILQHAWASVSHDSLYKNQFQVPERWHRDMARLAAVLEAVDQDFTAFSESLEVFAASHGAHLGAEKAARELEALEAILANEDDPAVRRAHLLRRAAIHKSCGRWAHAAASLESLSREDDAAVLRELGLAMCQAGEEAALATGREHLRRALALDDSDAEAWACLGRSLEGTEPGEALKCHRRAYTLRPGNPYYLASLLELQIAQSGVFAGSGLLAPNLEAAARACRTHADVGIELPWSLFTLSRLSLLRGDSRGGLEACLEAVDLCLDPNGGLAPEVLRDEAAGLDRLGRLRGALPGLEWLAMLHRAADLAAGLTQAPRTGETPRISVVIVAGTCRADDEAGLGAFAPLLREALAGFRGEVLSGGTTSGVSGLVGGLKRDLVPEAAARLTTVGYLPAKLPPNAMADQGYDRLVTTDGHDFGPLEPLRMWLDLLEHGVRPEQVALIGYGGGAVAGFEYRLALALGARVGMVEGGGRQAEALLAHQRWGRHRNLTGLVLDGMTLRAFLLDGGGALPADALELAARRAHEAAVREERHRVQDPGYASWERLSEDLKASNRQQIAFAAATLDSAGYGLRPAGEAAGGRALDPERLEAMAALEHGRWNLERLKGGWTPGPVRDHENKTTPYLVPWAVLPEEVRQWDRNAVLRWAGIFREAGLEIYDLSSGETVLAREPGDAA